MLDDLEQVAPVVAVRGDHDRLDGLALPETAVVVAGGHRIGLIHGDRARLIDASVVAASVAARRALPYRARMSRALVRRIGPVDAIVFGHWHEPVTRQRGRHAALLARARSARGGASRGAGRVGDGHDRDRRPGGAALPAPARRRRRCGRASGCWRSAAGASVPAPSCWTAGRVGAGCPPTRSPARSRPSAAVSPWAPWRAALMALSPLFDLVDGPAALPRGGTHVAGIGVSVSVIAITACLAILVRRRARDPLGAPARHRARHGRRAGLGAARDRRPAPPTTSPRTPS